MPLEVAFHLVDVADPDEDSVLWFDLGGIAADVSELFRAKTEGGSKRHAVNVARGAGGGRVHVGVGIDPDDTDAALGLSVVLGHASDGAGGDGMISAEDDGELAFAGGAFHHTCEAGTAGRDLGEEASRRGLGRDRFRLHDIDVA